ncbi:hypothetical protein [Nannocystis bainbridge]|uniref:Methyltransferase type 11 domain-containing protein n=1 Tax=Nannocystis bainbridge TaxID=2995303 RepID=A0ABT5E4R6_9BACT|nr:hypothetical protein [Nannocystis bainbridge]MDC0719928.1 hypothetical protein [Nannocystis bainbridge]
MVLALASTVVGFGGPALLARVALGGVALAEGAAAVRRFRERAEGFKAAAARAAATGRPLVVIGDPDAGLHTRMARAYDCGDICVDLTGCPACPVGIAADITKGPIDLASDSAVVYVSCVLEYVDDVGAAVQEIRRIAGSPENVFIVTVHPWSLTSRLYPGAQWAGSATADGGVAMRPVSSTEKAAIVGALAALVLAAFWRR